MHLLISANDSRISVNNSIEFAKALDSTKISHKLVIYPDDNHGLQKNHSAANQEIINWFNKYL
ncbi:alpha/beta hydrolase family protein [Pseudoalteromonas sp. ZZD1]|uniref:alpha/beta hydrolase family protein n=1 Tax=Pseudoalteromonas sp. ZZD1 TaxID=3139395 RepID=UPI003BACEAE7